MKIYGIYEIYEKDCQDMTSKRNKFGYRRGKRREQYE